MKRLQAPKDVLAALSLCAGYIIAAKLRLRFASIHPSATPVWPATGIAIAALLALGMRFWPAIFVGAFVVNLTTAGSVLTSLGIATGNMLEAVVAAYLVNRFASGRGALSKTLGIFCFWVYSGGVSNAPSAAFGGVCV